MKNILSQKKLKDFLHYCPQTGVFTWKNSHLGTRKNSIAGGKNSDGYIRICIDGKKYTAARLAILWMEGYFPEHEAEHRDRDRGNNKWENIREASRACNMRNTGMYARNKSGIKGVSIGHDKKWRATITVNQKKIHLGYFESVLNAAMARWKAERKHGFNRCNSQSTAFLFLRSQGLV